MPGPRRAASPAAPSPVVVDFPPEEAPPDRGSNICGAQVEAMLKQAEATDRLAKSGEALAFALSEVTERVGPAIDAIAHLGDAQKKLCAFIVGNRLKIFGSIPVVLLGIGAISPNAAEVLRKVLHAWGLS